jgi:amidase
LGDRSKVSKILIINWSRVQVLVAHLPSTVFPSGLSKGGLPIGLQAVGGEYQDYITIDFARLIADELGGFVPPPNYP